MAFSRSNPPKQIQRNGRTYTRTASGTYRSDDGGTLDAAVLAMALSDSGSSPSFSDSPTAGLGGGGLSGGGGASGDFGTD